MKPHYENNTPCRGSTLRVGLELWPIRSYNTEKGCICASMILQLATEISNTFDQSSQIQRPEKN